MQLINRYRPNGSARFEAENFVVADFWASDNLVDRHRERWAPNLLADMVEQAPGSSVIFNHRPDQKPHEGTVFQAELMRQTRLPRAIGNKAGFQKENRAIVKEEGFIRVMMSAFFERDASFINDLEGGSLGKVSTGGIVVDAVDRCALCGHDIWSRECPHLPPGFPLNWVSEDFIDGRKPEEVISPYTITSGRHYDSLELSFTPTPALPAADLVRAA